VASSILNNRIIRKRSDPTADLPLEKNEKIRAESFLF
jgi:hypothetical protein